MIKMPSAKFSHPRYWPYWLLLLCARIISWLPLRVLWVLGWMIGELTFRVHGASRRVAIINLELCFPELPARERKRLARRHFQAAGLTLLSTGIAWWGSRRRLQRLVQFKHREYYDQALAQGKNIILLAPHFLGLEIGGLYLSQERSVVSMYKKPKNELMDWVLRSRSRYAAIMVERDANPKALIRLIRAQRPFYYLPDQDPGHGNHTVFVPFFGVPAATITALSRIARLGEAIVIPCFTRQLPYGAGYEIRFHAPMTGFPSGDLAQDARQMNAEIEKGAHAMPEQYLWTYKRFKTRPERARGPYD